MKSLKVFLEKIVKEFQISKKYPFAGLTLEDGRADLAEEILSEYLTEDNKFCQCESCKEYHERIKNQ